MILVKITMIVIPEKQKEVLQTLLAIIGPPGKGYGHLSHDILCDIEDNNVFYLLSEWKTRKALDHYLGSDTFRVLLGTKSLLFEPMTIQILTVTDAETWRGHPTKKNDT